METRGGRGLRPLNQAKVQPKLMALVGGSERLRAEGIGHTATLNRRENALWEHRILSAEVDRWTSNVWFMLEKGF